MGKTVVISDLHADTWTDRLVGGSGKTKSALFFEFLDRCKAENIDRLIINGDIMDFPPYTGFVSLGPDAESAPRRDVLGRIYEFSTSVPVTYILGNHDIGLSGFKALGVNSFPPLKNFDYCYPDYVLHAAGGTTVLIEHGHFCDPALVLYARDLCLRTYDDNYYDPIRWKIPGAELPPAPYRAAESAWLMRIQPHAPAPAGRTFHEQVADTPEGIIGDAFHRLMSKFDARGEDFDDDPTGGGGIIDEITAMMSRAEPVQHSVKWWWKKHAYERMEKYLKTLDGGKPKTIAQIFGHTHLPHINEGDVSGVPARYFNIGTWRGDTDLCTYLVVDEAGGMRLHDWAADAPDARGL